MTDVVIQQVVANNISSYDRKLVAYKQYPVQNELFRLCLQRFEINLDRYKANPSETIKLLLDSLCSLLNMFDNVQITAYL